MSDEAHTSNRGRLALWVVWLCILTISSMGCFQGTTARIISWKGVTAFGYAGGQATEDSEFEFRHLRLYPEYLTVEHGIDGAFVIEMPDGRLFALSELSRDLIVEYCDERLERGGGDEDIEGAYDEGFYTSDVFKDPKYIFDFSRGNLIQVTASIPSASSPRRRVPALGDRGGARMYPLPLTYEQLVELLGEPQSREGDFFNYF